MEKKWPENAYRWYDHACKVFDYPSAPYGKHIKNLVEGVDSVLDLGCGIGAASIMIAPLCGKVIALDQDEKALNFLKAKIREQGIANIETVYQKFPYQEILSADVVIVLHAGNIMKSVENIKRVYESAKKGGYIACNGLSFRQEEPFYRLKEELGIRLNAENCDNGCFVKGALEALGAVVNCEEKIYQFGQPLDSMDEVAQFIAWQINANESMMETVKKYAERYTQKDGNKWLVPVARRSCGIFFVKNSSIA